MKRAATQTLLAVAIVAIAPVATVAPHGTVIVLAVAAAAIVLGQPWSRTVAGCRASAYLPPLAALMAWCLVTVAWAPAPSESAYLWLRMTGIMLCGLLLLPGADALSALETRRLQTAIVILGPLLPVLLFFDLYTDGSLTRLVRLNDLPWPYADFYLARGAVLLAILSWPIAYLLSRRVHVYAGVAFLPAVLVMLHVLPVFAAFVAVAAASAIFLLAWRWPSATLRVLTWGLPAMILVLPFVLLFTDVSLVLKEAVRDISIGWPHRLVIWQFVAERIAEKPLWGWGFDASRNLPGGGAVIDGIGPALDLHPHDAVMQVWVELGLPGAAWASAMVVLILRRIRRGEGNRVVVAVRLATFTTFLVIAQLSFGAWQSWWVASAWLAAFATAVAARPTPAPPGEGTGA